jgi:hypothetical protein
MYANVTVHIDETLDSDNLLALEQNLRVNSGIKSVLVNTKHPHLMIIDYDPKKINSINVLRGCEAMGYHAELTGM